MNRPQSDGPTVRSRN